ncbi:MAG: hypothetical protein IJH38_04135 [Clostridia bacterium]|nr:hypothetical protein [Clostridia bacterium]
MNLDRIGTVLGWALMLGFAALTLLEVPRFFRSALAPQPLPLPGDGQPSAISSRRMWGEVVLAFLLSRLLVVLVCLVGRWLDVGQVRGFFGEFRDNLFPWDARHYIHIMENGYVGSGDEQLFIVFFPLYPLLCRCITVLTMLPAEGVALAVSNLSLIAGGGVLYRLAALDGGEVRGRRAMLLLMFCPMTYFYSIAYSESVFLLVTLLAVYAARQRRFPAALVFGALASGGRILGLTVAIPIYWEWMRADRERRFGQTLPSRRERVRCALLCGLKTLPVSLGFLMYLWYNWRLFGNPTQFMIFQREHWYQRLGTLANTFQYSLHNALDYDDFLYQLGVWRPQVALMLAIPLLILWRRRRTRPGDTAYALVYHWVAFAPTWLLSGPRYASCNYALYLMLAGIGRRKRGFILLMALWCAMLGFMTWVGLWQGKVY